MGRRGFTPVADKLDITCPKCGGHGYWQAWNADEPYAEKCNICNGKGTVMAEIRQEWLAKPRRLRP